MSSKKNYKEKILRKKEEKPEEPELPKYRDRAKERREDQNPDYEPTELGAFHAVAPPGAVDVRTADAQKISIENSKYLGGDLEHTHLVKGLDYALLHKVRSEIDKKPEADGEVDGVSKGEKDSQLSFRTAMAKSVYQWIIKPQSNIKANEMFLPGRMAFIFNMEEGHSHDIPTTVHRSKADCPVPQEMVTVSVDGSVLDRIAKIMSYLRLGSSGKVLKKKKKEKGEIREKMSASAIGHEEDVDHKTQSVNGTLVSKADRAPPPQTAHQSHPDAGKKHQSVASRLQEEDIFVGDGVDYDVPSKEAGGSPLSEDMEESPHNRDRQAFVSQPAYGPLSAPETSQVWQQTNGYDVMQESALASGYQGEWQDYQYAEQFAYPAEYIQQPLQGYELQVDANMPLDPNFMTQEEKDRGLGSVFKRDDQRLQQLREKDSREKDPNFISESYSECYPGYQEYNHEIVDSDDDADLSKMDMGGRAKGRMHRWDFETEEEWATYNEQKEAMPKAAFQFGVKMQDGRKTRKQNKEHKFNNELHQINKLLAKKITEKGGTYEYDDETPSGKKLRI